MRKRLKANGEPFILSDHFNGPRICIPRKPCSGPCIPPNGSNNGSTIFDVIDEKRSSEDDIAGMLRRIAAASNRLLLSDQPLFSYSLLLSRRKFERQRWPFPVDRNRMGTQYPQNRGVILRLPRPLSTPQTHRP